MILQWRNTADNPRLGPLDARAIFPIFLWLFHITWWTFAIAAASILFLVVIGKKGFPVNAAVFQLISILRGRIRTVSNRSLLRRRCRW